MTEEERQQLSELLEKAIRGDKQLISEVCEFIDRYRRMESMNRLSRAGVVGSLDEAYQELLLTVQHKLSHLKVVDAFESWLWRLERSVAKQYRPRYARYAPRIGAEAQVFEQPREIGARTVVIAGNSQIARIFEPLARQDRPSWKQPLFKPLTDGILANASMSNRSNYPRKIDVWHAMSKLPPRWAETLRLRHIEEYTAAETAEILGCSVKRVYRLTQKGENRMRELLPGYNDNGLATLQSRSRRAKRRARTKHPGGPTAHFPSSLVQCETTHDISAAPGGLIGFWALRANT